ncbi:MAG TPA: HAMP domain-containing sensor histidine kinase [Ktedonobacteraceae bacterium]|nr:HAMP domain-containing sensor histidine kinase [Ktedonobacteraceae bacterium]
MRQAPDGSENNGKQDRLLYTLERLLQIETVELKAMLDEVAQLVAEALSAEKVDVFLYDPSRETLVALGTSQTPLGKRQHALGLDRMPLVNGGYLARVFLTGTSYLTGHLEQDPDRILGMSSIERLGIRSEVVVALDVHQERRGVLLASSRAPDFFSEQDLQFLEAVARWIGIVIHRTELSERLRAEEVQQSRRMLAEELLAVVAHGLRSYLTALHAHLDLLHMRARHDRRQEDLHDTTALKGILRRFERRIADLLDVARLDQGLFTLDERPVNLASLVQETVQALKTPETEIAIQTPYEVIVVGDVERLRQALDNLLANALTHASPKTPVVVKLTKEQRHQAFWAILTVSNTGPVIPSTLLPRLFQPFVKGARSKGLGLGLYLAHSIARAHQGTLTLDTSAGENVQFSFSLPLAVEYHRESEQEEETSNESEEVPPGSS